jgi:dipeptidyl aminopeptidase/acylaminoacyl peptidase
VVHFSLSPDGARVAFVSFASGHADVWVQNLDGSGLRQLTNDPASKTWPAWSPDGNWIVYGSNRDGEAGTWRVPAAGGQAEKLFSGFFRGDWIRKPDGSGTMLASTGPRLLDVERRSVIWSEPRQGSHLPMFSSDGKLISDIYPDGNDRVAIWVYDVATGKSRLAVKFPGPFQIATFRANLADHNRAFVFTRQYTTSHIVMLDRFMGKPLARSNEACQGVTPAEQRGWRTSIYGEIEAMMQLEGLSLSIEEACRAASVGRAGSANIRP